MPALKSEVRRGVSTCPQGAPDRSKPEEWSGYSTAWWVCSEGAEALWEPGCLAQRCFPGTASKSERGGPESPRGPLWLPGRVPASEGNRLPLGATSVPAWLWREDLSPFYRWGKGRASGLLDSRVGVFTTPLCGQFRLNLQSVFRSCSYSRLFSFAFRF